MREFLLGLCVAAITINLALAQTIPRSAASIDCSAQADAKGLHGAERAAFMTQCKSNVAQAASVYVVANTQPPDAYLSLRSEPTTKSGVRIVQMPNGTKLEVLQRNPDGWWRVKIVDSGQEGWTLSGQGKARWIVSADQASNKAPGEPSVAPEQSQPEEASRGVKMPAKVNAPTSNANQRASFDCFKAKSASARLICSDPALSEADRELGEVFSGSIANLQGDDKKGRLQAQLDWIRARNTRCGLGADKAAVATGELRSSWKCMMDALLERKAEVAGSRQFAKSQAGQQQELTLEGTFGSLKFEGRYTFHISGSNTVYDVKSLTVHFVANSQVNRVDAVKLDSIQIVATKKVAEKVEVLFKQSVPLAMPNLDNAMQMATVENLHFEVPTTIVTEATHVGFGLIAGQMLWPVSTELKTTPSAGNPTAAPSPASSIATASTPIQPRSEVSVVRQNDVTVTVCPGCSGQRTQQATFYSVKFHYRGLSGDAHCTMANSSSGSVDGIGIGLTVADGSESWFFDDDRINSILSPIKAAVYEECKKGFQEGVLRNYLNNPAKGVREYFSVSSTIAGMYQGIAGNSTGLNAPWSITVNGYKDRENQRLAQVQAQQQLALQQQRQAEQKQRAVAQLASRGTTASGAHSAEVLQCINGFFPRMGFSAPMFKPSPCSDYIAIESINTLDSRDIAGGIEVMTDVTVVVIEPFRSDSMLAGACGVVANNTQQIGARVRLQTRIAFEKWNSGLRCTSQHW
jgi:uncharacterized protein YecT (DUF1311 family)